MEIKESVIFYQNDLMSVSFQSFAEMREKEELIDFRISYENRSLSGHRVILSGAVPYFSAMFSSSEEEINLGEINPDALAFVFNFAYSGRIEITSENVETLLSVSKFLQLTQVHDACWTFLENGLQLNNVWKIRRLAENHRRSKTMASADHYIRQNFEVFSKSQFLSTLPFAYLKEITMQDDIVVSGEESICDTIIKWVRVCPSERKDMLPELLATVRMSYLTPEYLIDRVSREELVRTSVLCRDLVEEAKLYHLLPEKRSKLCAFTTRPRMYDGKYQQMTSTQKSNSYRVFALCSPKSKLSMKLWVLENERWQNLSTYHRNCVFHIAALNGTVYIFLNKTVLAFVIKTLKWLPLETQYESLISSATALHNDRIYFFGISHVQNQLGIVQCFHPELKKFLNDEKMTRPLQYMGAAAVADFIYITGGVFKGNVYKTVERYNPSTKEWIEVSPMLSKRWNHGCCSLNHMVYVCGGDRGNLLSTVEVYDPVMDQWKFISSMNAPKRELVVVPHAGKLYSYGRQIAYLNYPDIATEIYNPEQDEWEPGVQIPDSGNCEILLASMAIGSDEKVDKKMLSEMALNSRSTANDDNGSVGDDENELNVVAENTGDIINTSISKETQRKKGRPKRRNARGIQFKCFRCRRAGHFARDCRSVVYEDIRCSSCGVLGHTSLSCPEK